MTPDQVLAVGTPVAIAVGFFVYWLARNPEKEQARYQNAFEAGRAFREKYPVAIKVIVGIVIFYAIVWSIILIRNGFFPTPPRS